MTKEKARLEKVPVKPDNKTPIESKLPAD